MITADLDRELSRSLHSLITTGVLPASAAGAASGTWRLAPGATPAAYSTALPLELAGGPSAGLAAALAAPLRAVPWIQTAVAAGGYLTIVVSAQALAASAARMAAAGSACASSTILRGTAAATRPWPDLTAGRSWRSAWQDQAEAAAGHLAHVAGATVAPLTGQERGPIRPSRNQGARPPLAAAVAYAGEDSVRYWLARTPAGSALPPFGLAVLRARQPWNRPRPDDPLCHVQQAHAHAASTLRWAGDLGLDRAATADQLGGLLCLPAERHLLTVLSFLPVKVAAAARRKRPDELPRYLEDVGSAWLTCRQEAPALPFGGRSAPASPEVAGARLVLADAARAVLAAGLELTGISARSRL